MDLHARAPKNCKDFFVERPVEHDLLMRTIFFCPATAAVCQLKQQGVLFTVTIMIQRCINTDEGMNKELEIKGVCLGWGHITITLHVDAFSFSNSPPEIYENSSEPHNSSFLRFKQVRCL